VRAETRKRVVVVEGASSGKEEEKEEELEEDMVKVLGVLLVDGRW
jgi:hypothetical protein